MAVNGFDRSITDDLVNTFGRQAGLVSRLMPNDFPIVDGDEWGKWAKPFDEVGPEYISVAARREFIICLGRGLCVNLIGLFVKPMHSGQSSPDLEVAAAFCHSADKEAPQEVPLGLSLEESTEVQGLGNSGLQAVNQCMQTEDGYVIHVAAGSGDVEAIENELNKGIDIDLLDKRGQSALSWASSHNQKDAVIYLLSKGASLSAIGHGGNYPLTYAASHGFLDVCQLLIRAGADVDLENEEKASALMYAAYEGRHVVVKLLLESGADLTAQDIHGDTALSIAAARGKDQVIKTIEKYLEGLLLESPS